MYLYNGIGSTGPFGGYNPLTATRPGMRLGQPAAPAAQAQAAQQVPMAMAQSPMASPGLSAGGGGDAAPPPTAAPGQPPAQAAPGSHPLQMPDTRAQDPGVTKTIADWKAAKAQQDALAEATKRWQAQQRTREIMPSRVERSTQPPAGPPGAPPSPMDRIPPPTPGAKMGWVYNQFTKKMVWGPLGVQT